MNKSTKGMIDRDDCHIICMGDRKKESSEWSLVKTTILYSLLSLLSAPYSLVTWFDGVIRHLNLINTLIIHVHHFKGEVIPVETVSSYGDAS